MTNELDNLDAQQFDRICSALREEFRKAGHGSVKRVMVSLEMNRATLDRAISRRSLKLMVLLRILRELDVDQSLFFMSVFPHRVKTKVPVGAPPPAVKVGMERMRIEGWFDDDDQ